MKELLLFALIFAAFGDSLFAQDTLNDPKMMPNVRIITLDRQIRNGYLYALSDSSLLLAAGRRPPAATDSPTAAHIKSYGYRDMNNVVVYYRGSFWRMPLKGLLVGAVIGAVAGFASGDDPQEYWIRFSATDKAIGGGLLGGATGLLVGFCIGALSHKTFYIGGNRKKYERMRQKTLARLGL